MTNFYDLSNAERFMIHVFTVLIGILIVGIVVWLVFHFFSKDSDEAQATDSDKTSPKKTFSGKDRKKVSPEEVSDSFVDKLGKKIVNYMIEVTNSVDKNLVSDRIKKIREECERLSTVRNIPPDSKKIISTVLVWAKNFNPDRHINDMRILGRSNQIVYNDERKDFKLRISG